MDFHENTEGYFAAMTRWGLMIWFSSHSRRMGFAICNSFSLSGQHGLPPSQCCFLWASWHGRAERLSELSPMLEFSVPIIFGYLVCQDVLRMSGYDALNTPFRTADLVAIHLCSLVDVTAMVFLLECLSSSIFSHPLASRRTLTISKNA